jgi:hypothetical protein
MTAPQKKVMPLNAIAPKSAPTAPARAYRDFDDLAHAADTLMKWAADEWAAQEKDEEIPDWRRVSVNAIRNELGQYEALGEFFERDELYDIGKRLPRYYKGDDCPVWCDHQLKRKVVAEQVAMLIGSFPTGTPSAPEVYTKLMIEEIIAANPSAMALESTCRQIRRTKTFLPAISEVLEALREHEKRWSDIMEAVAYFDEKLAGATKVTEQGERRQA